MELKVLWHWTSGIMPEEGHPVKELKCNLYMSTPRQVQHCSRDPGRENSPTLHRCVYSYPCFDTVLYYHFFLASYLCVFIKYTSGCIMFKLLCSRDMAKSCLLNLCDFHSIYERNYGLCSHYT